MPRVIGIDPGTLSIDLCGLDNGNLFLDRSLPTSAALSDPSVIVGLLEQAGREAPLDSVVGPSGYGLPLIAARDLTDRDLRLAYLSAQGEEGGLGGLGSLMRALARSTLPVVLTPGVVHLTSVPAHRKVNRVDMGTADKVCAVALAIRQEAERRGCGEHDVSLILLELGGAFTAAIAVERGRIVDGIGGTSGPLGWRSAGALDGEVAFLAGSVPKRLLFGGGVTAVADAGSPDCLNYAATSRGCRGLPGECGQGRSRPGRFRLHRAGGHPVRTARARRVRAQRIGATDRQHEKWNGRPRARRLRRDGEARGARSGVDRRRPRGWTLRSVSRDTRHSRRVRYGARPPVRDLARRRAGAPGNTLAGHDSSTSSYRAG
jgi:hypothetical protein